MMLASIAPYLDDRRDAVTFAQRPMMMVPRHGTLAPLGVGEARYLAADDGVYVEARSLGLHVCLPIAQAALPFGAVERHITLDGGRLPICLRDTIVAQAERSSPHEAAVLVTLAADGRYELVEPTVADASGGHITYAQLADDERLVFDIHTHGRGPAYFSATDDESDHQRLGPYIAMLLGGLDGSHQPQAVARVCVPPHLIDIGVEEVVEVRQA